MKPFVCHSHPFSKQSATLTLKFIAKHKCRHGPKRGHCNFVALHTCYWHLGITEEESISSVSAKRRHAWGLLLGMDLFGRWIATIGITFQACCSTNISCICSKAISCSQHWGVGQCWCTTRPKKDHKCSTQTNCVIERVGSTLNATWFPHHSRLWSALHYTSCRIYAS